MRKEEIPKVLLEEFTDQQLEEVQNIISKYKDKPGSLIPILEEVQDITGYLPDPIQEWIAKDLRIPPSRVFGVVTFYSFFTMVPKGRHTIRVCLGTACYVRGGKKNLEEFSKILKIEPGTTTGDRRFSLDTVRCLGACGLAPTMIIDNDTFRQVKPSRLNEIIKEYE